ncbi:unnamed protein product [Nippostrongylus brasiliensis]|uniref:Uncharacterized protein n=1 Tax=Nippostrongylus brasiliensis TaxID=27835 RepID=A0A0N4YTL7_NIPBR|nr:unnamed protein product [Nippostrongylus brasiliensis]
MYENVFFLLSTTHKRVIDEEILSATGEIGATRIDRLRVSGCAQPMLDVLPEGPVRSLVLTNCQIADIDPKLKDIKEGAFNGLPQLRLLRIERNQICSLSSNALSEVKPRIELLDLSGNCFSNIPAQNLRNCVKLMYLDLSDNKISEVRLFRGLLTYSLLHPQIWMCYCIKKMCYLNNKAFKKTQKNDNEFSLFIVQLTSLPRL